MMYLGREDQLRILEAHTINSSVMEIKRDMGSVEFDDDINFILKVYMIKWGSYGKDGKNDISNMYVVCDAANG